MGGALGSLLVGVFSDPSISGGPAWGGEQFLKQLTATVIAAIYSYVVSIALLKLIGLGMRLKPTKEEMADIDKAFHGELAYTSTPGNSFYATGLGAAAAAAVGGVAPGPGKTESATKDVKDVKVDIKK